MTLASFGNFTYDRDLGVINDDMANVTIPPFGNISIYDNSSTYGDNRARVEVGDDYLGFSRDEIVYTYINHFKITSMTPLIVSMDG